MTAMRNGFPQRWTAAGCGLALVSAITGCGQKEPAESAPASIPVVQAPASAKLQPEIEADELPPIRSSLPNASAPAPAAVAIRPELEEAFEKLFKPGLEISEWEKAQEQLIAAGADATPLLVRELKSNDVARREQASSMFVLLGSAAESAATDLLEATKNESSFVRANCAAALAQFGTYQADAKETLVKLLDSPEPELRRLAAMNLASIGDGASDLVPRLTLALDDSDAEVVRPIAQLLGVIGPAARPALSKLQQVAARQSGETKSAIEQAVQQIEAAEPVTP
jgi:HEAT repeat protein